MNGRMSFGNVPPDVLAGAVEKLLAKMDESDLAALYQRELSAMPPDVVGAFVEAVFAAFRERGESSEDAAEGSGTTLDAIANRTNGAVAGLLRYALDSPDLLKEATAVFVARHPPMIAMLPAALREALAERFTRSLSSS
ncbi:MAG: hypothetical protein JO104_09700 [Candidatus Eremiobacteraeota bacterium]|nr:hypothetical protein [Candidatus Eremiobacteraeota bacterium]